MQDRVFQDLLVAAIADDWSYVRPQDVFQGEMCLRELFRRYLQTRFRHHTTLPKAMRPRKKSFSIADGDRELHRLLLSTVTKGLAHQGVTFGIRNAA